MRLTDSQSDDHTCQDPILAQDTFFATQSFSVGPAPTDNYSGWATPSAYTVFADVSAQTPGALPVDPQAMSGSEKLGVGLGISLGVLIAVGVVGVLWWLRRKRRYEVEVSSNAPVYCQGGRGAETSAVDGIQPIVRS